MQISPWWLKARSRSNPRLYIGLRLPPLVSRQFSIVTTPLIGLTTFKGQMGRVTAWTGRLSQLQVCDSAVRSSSAVPASVAAQMIKVRCRAHLLTFFRKQIKALAHQRWHLHFCRVN